MVPKPPTLFVCPMNPHVIKSQSVVEFGVPKCKNQCLHAGMHDTVLRGVYSLLLLLLLLLLCTSTLFRSVFLLLKMSENEFDFFVR